MTSSARNSTACGIVIPSALAAERLIDPRLPGVRLAVAVVVGQR